jgi:hypothetical protein
LRIKTARARETHFGKPVLRLVDTGKGFVGIVVVDEGETVDGETIDAL